MMPHECPISYPQRYTEFEVQAWLYVKLHRLGYDVRGEVSCTIPRGRFDLVIFDEGHRPAIIIEVKKRYVRQRRTPQHLKYASLGITLIYCEGPSQYRGTVKYIQKLIKPTKPILIIPDRFS